MAAAWVSTLSSCGLSKQIGAGPSRMCGQRCGFFSRAGMRARCHRRLPVLAAQLWESAQLWRCGSVWCRRRLGCFSVTAWVH